MVVLAANCPDATLGDFGAVRVHRFAGSNVELGAACGVPFPVAAVAILSPGESSILSL
jgi:large subunit ribosomal protein L30e